SYLYCCFFPSSGPHSHLHSFPTRRSSDLQSGRRVGGAESLLHHASGFPVGDRRLRTAHAPREVPHLLGEAVVPVLLEHGIGPALDRKSTRLNSSHVAISYAVFCLKKKQ